MIVRLGFAITTALRPDILLIDEVLAVGDQAFQRKCIDRLEALQSQGVTLILVSHSMDQIRHICDRAIWIAQGRVQADDDVDLVAGEYVNALVASDPRWFATGSLPLRRFGTMQVEITQVEILGADNSTSTCFTTGDMFRVRIHYRTNERFERPTFGLAFYRRDGTHVNGPNSVRDGYEIPFVEGAGYVDYVIDQLPLNPGRYELTVAIYDHDSTVAIDHHHRMYPFEVRARSGWTEEGVIHIPARWRHIAQSSVAVNVSG
jgi:lipopolysaccharide transport system ATP-binding protein